jgi:tRNA pseudouridine13 synthase
VFNLELRKRFGPFLRKSEFFAVLERALPRAPAVCASALHERIDAALWSSFMRLAMTPEDFVVDEIALFAPSGEGGHTYVRVEKRGRTTEEVARLLARLAGAPHAEVGYAGRKDKQAVTRQWFSVPGITPEAALALEAEGVRALEAVRHGHRLRTGQLRGNRFELVVRELSAEQLRRAATAAERIRRVGIPNKYGAQRFGREGDNAERARALLAGREAGRDRRAARFLLSALQAEVFNAFLRTRPLPLDALEVGEVATIHASGGSFVVEDLTREAPRAAAFEISASGPLFGTKLLRPRGAAAEREAAVLRAAGIPDPVLPPRGIKLRGARRPVRVPVPDLSLEPVAESALRLRFTLPAGSYATVLAEALFTDAASGT